MKWAQAIIKIYGNIEIKWENWNAKKQDFECHIGNGEVFKP